MKGIVLAVFTNQQTMWGIPFYQRVIDLRWARFENVLVLWLIMVGLAAANANAQQATQATTTTQPTATPPTFTIGQKILARRPGEPVNSMHSATVVGVGVETLKVQFEYNPGTTKIFIEDALPLITYLKGQRIRWDGRSPGSGVVESSQVRVVTVRPDGNTSATSTVLREDIRTPTGTDIAVLPAVLSGKQFLPGQRVHFKYQSMELDGNVEKDEGNEQVIIHVQNNNQIFTIPRSQITPLGKPADPHVLGVIPVDTSAAVVYHVGTLPNSRPTIYIPSQPPTFDDPPTHSFILNSADQTDIANLTPKLLGICFKSPLAMVGYTKENDAILQRIDLVKGKIMPLLRLESGGTILDVSTDGLTVATQRSSVLMIWTLDGPQPKRLVAFEPLPNQILDPVVTKVRLIDGQHILIGNSESLSCWHYPDARQVWQCYYTPTLGLWTLDESRQILAVAEAFNFRLLNPISGQCFKDTLSKPMHFYVKPRAFSPNGASIALVDNSNILLNMTVKNPNAIVTRTENQTTDSVYWLDNDLLLLGDGSVIPKTTGRPIYKYADASHVVVDCQGRAWNLLNPSNGVSTLTWAKPDLQELHRIWEKAEKPDQYAMKPGDKVSIELNLQGASLEMQKSVMGLLTQTLETQGQSIADFQPTRLVATVKLGEACKITVNNSWSTPHPVDITTYPATTELAVVIDNKSVWSMKYTYKPKATMFISTDSAKYDIPENLKNLALDQINTTIYQSPFIWPKLPSYVVKKSDETPPISSGSLFAKNNN